MKVGGVVAGKVIAVLRRRIGILGGDKISFLLVYSTGDIYTLCEKVVDMTSTLHVPFS